MKKTNAIRLLEKYKVSFETVSYTYNPSNLNVSTIAKDNNLDIKLIYKTIVAINDKKEILVIVIPGDEELDLKKIATLSACKKVQILPQKELLNKTGYIRGGCSPIGMKKDFPVYIDEKAASLNFFYVNAGVRGLLLKIAPLTLSKICNGVFEDLTKPAH